MQTKRLTWPVAAILGTLVFAFGLLACGGCGGGGGFDGNPSSSATPTPTPTATATPNYTVPPAPPF